MYNVQLSEFWKQRVDKETIHNAPYFAGSEAETASIRDDVSEAPSRATTRTGVSVASTATRNKIVELEQKLEEERRKREQLERELQRVQNGQPQ